MRASSLSTRERAVRGTLGVFLAFVAYHVGLTNPGTEPKVLAWGALVLAVFALGSAVAGSSGPLARLGLDADWSVAYLAARLYVGWEFLNAGLDKATNSWYSGAGAAEVKGTLTGAVAQSHATATNPYPAVANWFGSVSTHVFIAHSELLSYLVVTGELCVGIGLITGLFLRVSALFGVALNSLFMFSGALGAGLNPEMVLLGMGVLTATVTGVYALSADRYLIERLSGLGGRVTHGRMHVPVAQH
jgi:thiosulfate dehydrogenase (quinone) large subunit